MRHLRLPLAAAIACLAIATTATADRPVATAAKKTCKTTYASKSIYKRAKVVVIRGVSCKRALQVAKAYDNKARTARGWACGLARGERTRLFSCGKGVKRGSLTSGKSAFVAYGTGRKG